MFGNGSQHFYSNNSSGSTVLPNNLVNSTGSGPSQMSMYSTQIGGRKRSHRNKRKSKNMRFRRRKSRKNRK